MNPEKFAILGVTAVIAIILAVALMSSPNRTDEADEPRTGAAPIATDADAGDPEDLEPAWEDLDDLMGTLRDGGARTRVPPRPKRRDREINRDGAPPPAPEMLGGGTYVIRSGDTYDRIAHRVYGKRSFAGRITDENPGVDPRRLQIGQKIRLPRIPRAEDARPGQAPRRETRERAGGDTARAHRVISGEVLSTLARRYYGSSTRWRRIYDANRDILSSPDRVAPGMRLRIP